MLKRSPSFGLVTGLHVVIIGSLLTAQCAPKIGNANETITQAYVCADLDDSGVSPPTSIPKLRRPAEAHQGSAPFPIPPSMPLCGKTQVPLNTKSMNALKKGNPLLAPPSSAEPLSLPDESPGVRIRSFEQYYGNYDKQDARPGVEVPPAPPNDCKGDRHAAACYYYGSAGLQAITDGAGMLVKVCKPRLDNSGGPAHTLSEISVQGGQRAGDIVEIGWTIEESNASPKLFVFHWKDWQGTCYNGCGWKQWSKKYYPGMDLSRWIDKSVYLGYVFWQGNWWVWFEDEWIGYFPGSEWNDTFSQSSLTQWFGEVATNNGVPTNTEMGDGRLSADPLAAFMREICVVDAQTWTCWNRDQQVLSRSPNYMDLYDIGRTGFGEARYGGPGGKP